MTKRQMEQLRKFVRRGAVFLDERRPSWFTKINTAKLNLASCSLCVLGQLYATENDPLGYNRGLEILNGAVASDPSAFGFGMRQWDELDPDLQFALLTELWNEEIAARRKARRAKAAA